MPGLGPEVVSREEKALCPVLPESSHTATSCEHCVCIPPAPESEGPHLLLLPLLPLTSGPDGQWQFGAH